MLKKTVCRCHSCPLEGTVSLWCCTEVEQLESFLSLTNALVRHTWTPLHTLHTVFTWPFNTLQEAQIMAQWSFSLANCDVILLYREKNNNWTDNVLALKHLTQTSWVFWVSLLRTFEYINTNLGPCLRRHVPRFTSVDEVLSSVSPSHSPLPPWSWIPLTYRSCVQQSEEMFPSVGLHFPRTSASWTSSSSIHPHGINHCCSEGLGSPPRASQASNALNKPLI